MGKVLRGTTSSLLRYLWNSESRGRAEHIYVGLLLKAMHTQKHNVSREDTCHFTHRTWHSCFADGTDAADTEERETYWRGSIGHQLANEGDEGE